MGRLERIFVTLLIVLALSIAVVFGIRLQTGVQPAEDASVATIPTSDKEPNLKNEILAGELTNVWDLGFTPDGTAIFTERIGTISKIDGGKKMVIHTVRDVRARGEGGLMGLAIDPDFAENRLIYACYNTANDIRITRWRVNEATTALSDQTHIVIGMPTNNTTFPGRHSGCRPRFGPDGALWIGTGDVAVGTNSQDPKSLGGKILRVDRDGKASAGNLGAPFDPRIFSYGHRNVQGLVIFDQPLNGILGFSVEHGSQRDDEINLLKSGNFGRDPVPGYNDTSPMTDKSKFPDSIDAVWSSGTPTIAPSGAALIKGEKWGVYNGQLAVAVLKAKHLRLFGFDQNGKITTETELYKEEFGRIRSAVMGPGEALYITTDNGDVADKIIKITPQ